MVTSCGCCSWSCSYPKRVSPSSSQTLETMSGVRYPGLLPWTAQSDPSVRTATTTSSAKRSVSMVASFPYALLVRSLVLGTRYANETAMVALMQYRSSAIHGASRLRASVGSPLPSTLNSSPSPSPKSISRGSNVNGSSSSRGISSLLSPSLLLDALTATRMVDSTATPETSRATSVCPHVLFEPQLHSHRKNTPTPHSFSRPDNHGRCNGCDDDNDNGCNDDIVVIIIVIEGRSDSQASAVTESLQT